MVKSGESIFVHASLLWSNKASMLSFMGLYGQLRVILRS